VSDGLRAALRAWWLALARRERLMLAAGAAIVLAAIVFLALIEPAWTTSTRLARELPQLREEAAELDALAREAKELRRRAGALESADSARRALGEALARGPLANIVQVTALDERRIQASAKGVNAALWFAWVEQAAREYRLRVAALEATRAAKRGEVDAQVTFEIARSR